MINLDECDMNTLFALRYLLDKPNDVVKLDQDILDLQVFPERLEDSYQAEWKTYIKRELHKRSESNEQSIRGLNEKLEHLLSGNDETFNQAMATINTAIKVNNSEDVAVITTPLKRYIQQLLKI